MKAVSFDKTKYFHKSDFYKRRAHLIFESLSAPHIRSKKDGTMERDC